MASNRSTKARRASAADATELRALRRDAENSDAATIEPTATIASTEEAAGRPAQRAAIEQAMAQQNLRLGRSPGPIGPIGRTVLMVALLALVGLIAVWVLLAL